MTTETVRTPCDSAIHPLDDPFRSSLRGAHATFARWSGRVARYDVAVAGFVGHPQVLDEQDWADLAVLVGPSTEVSLRGHHVPPAGWGRLGEMGSVQLEGSAFAVRSDRRQGLSTRLVRAVGAGIRARGEIHFLHARAENGSAIRLYESLGFRMRKRSVLTLVRTPGRSGRQP